MNFWRKSLLAAAVLAASVGSASAQKTLKVVMHSDLKIVDPIWTTAYITRNHGYMIYDTLFAMDEKGEIKPQMVEKYDDSADKKTFTFTLRDGLAWHDGKPVTAEDCIASIKRWAARDLARPEADDLRRDDDGARCEDLRRQAEGADRPADLRARQAVLERALHDAEACRRDRSRTRRSPTSPAPARSCSSRTNGSRATRRSTSSSTTTSRAPKPASGLAGGKVVKIDRVEWLAISDHQQAVNALLAGEIDVIEAPPHDLLPLLKGDANVALINYNPLGNQYTLRPNHLHKPFDNPKVRQALLLRAATRRTSSTRRSATPNYYKTCKAMFVCGTPLASEKGMEGLLELNFNKAKELLKEAGYDGTPIVLLQSTDLQVLTNLAPVAKSLMEKAGFKVDMQSSDWQTVVARRVKKDPAVGRRLARDAHLVGLGRHPQSGDGRLHQRRLRQGRCSAGPATQRSRSCATTSPARPIRPSRRRSPRPCRCARPRWSPTSISASGTSRSRRARTSPAS